MDAHTLLEQIGEQLSVRRAFGEPIERGGQLVIPVALVAGGGGGGEGTATPAADADDGAAATQSGSGGGMGGVVLPLGVYVVSDDGVRWKPVIQPMLLALPAIGLVRLVLKARSRRALHASKS